MQPTLTPPAADAQSALTYDESTPNEAINRMVAEALDHQLLTYAKTEQSFTISEARNALLRLPELEQLDPALLRYRVRDRLNVLERDGLAQRVGIQGKNRPLYRLQLEAIPAPQATSAATAPDLTTPLSPALAEYLDTERKQLRAEMQAILAEANHYEHLLKRFPDEQLRIGPLLENALERGGELKGQLDANIRLRNTLASREELA
ncbi:hypothetical protein [Litchfieldella xinjiangensis]|uniref:hypothetical protein n=1 Tax=Litchfieldella xinjiangensis TaxID=1166948 RepID=UPI0018CF2D92|nr:hypothetical protein [Halomonas xinjiangensis]